MIIKNNTNVYQNNPLKFNKKRTEENKANNDFSSSKEEVFISGKEGRENFSVSPNKSSEISSRGHKTKEKGKKHETSSYQNGTTGEQYQLSSGKNNSSIAMIPESDFKAGSMSPEKMRMYDTFHQRLKDILPTHSWYSLKGGENTAVNLSEFTPVKPSELSEMDKRFEALASDPAKGNKITPGTIEEATIAFVAEKGGIIKPPVLREQTGLSEFIDVDNRTWDVKSPISPPPGAGWPFDANHQIVKIRHDLSQGDTVLLNLSKCNIQDTQTLLSLLKSELADNEKSLLYILANKEAAK